MKRFSGNYTGPYWSNGKVQTSVEFGEEIPLSQLDKLSRLHDSAYAKYRDREHREAADILYNRAAQQLAENFPQIAGSIVLYGNYANRQSQRLADNLIHYGPLGALWFAAQNIADSNRMLNGTYLSKETQEVEDYYRTDPKSGQVQYDPYATGKIKSFDEQVHDEFAQKRADDAARVQVMPSTTKIGTAQNATTVYQPVIDRIGPSLDVPVLVPEAAVPESDTQQTQSTYNPYAYDSPYFNINLNTLRKKRKRKFPRLH